jgi:hypothetical protein
LRQLVLGNGFKKTKRDEPRVEVPCIEPACSGEAAMETSSKTAFDRLFREALAYMRKISHELRLQFRLISALRGQAEACDSSTQPDKTKCDQPCTSSTPAMSIVFIDFDDERGKRTCDHLRRVGLMAVAASDVSTAIHRVNTHKPSVVLLGSMPLLEGSLLWNAIKEVVPNAIVLVYTEQPEAWQLSAEFVAGVVPPCRWSQELVEEICAWLTHRSVGQHEPERGSRTQSASELPLIGFVPHTNKDSTSTEREDDPCSAASQQSVHR